MKCKHSIRVKMIDKDHDFNSFIFRNQPKKNYFENFVIMGHSLYSKYVPWKHFKSNSEAKGLKLDTLAPSVRTSDVAHFFLLVTTL